MGSNRGWDEEGIGGGRVVEVGSTAEPDLSWMSFSPEAHGLKPALSVWPTRSSNDENYYLHHNSSPHDDEHQQQQQKERRNKNKNKRFGIGFGIGRSESLRGFDESDYEWIEEDLVQELHKAEVEEQLNWSRARSSEDQGKEQGRKSHEDFDYDHYRDDVYDDGDDDESTFGDDGGLPSSSSRLPGGIRRPSPPPPPPSEFSPGGRQQKSWLESLDEGNVAAQVPWSDTLSRRLQSAAMVAFVGCLVALAISILFLYLSFGATARPPSSCEVEKVVLNFTAQRIRLRGGRYISFREQGASADIAQHSLLIVHDLLSSRLAGIPGISDSLLKEFGVRLIAYDRPGYGQSDPHLGRSYNSSAQDMADIADALGVEDKFWVAGFGSGGPHVWAAINYIPERLAGVALFAPAGNFYSENMNKDEVSETWGLLTLRQKWMYSMARLFPALLPSFLQKTLIDQSPSPFRSMGGSTIGSKDQVLMEKEEILGFWKRDLSEALQQKCAFPVAEELILLVNNWGFNLAKLPFNEIEVKTLLQHVVGLFQTKEKPRIFSGPIHIWQGTDDQQVPATFNEYAKRMIEIRDVSKRTDDRVNLHILDGEGHYSWFWFCDECHRTILTSLFQLGAVSGPYGRQVFSTEEYEAILAAVGGAKERAAKLTKTEEAPLTSAKNVERATDDALYKDTDFLAASGGAKEGVDKLTKTEEAPVTFAKNVEMATPDALYRGTDSDSEEAMSSGIKSYVPESCDVPIDLSAFIIKAIDERIIKAIDERIKKYFK
ncbi:unnamed protein product [Calypogeia fissa]